MSNKIVCPNCGSEYDTDVRELVDYEFDENNNFNACIQYECYNCDERFTMKVKFSLTEAELVERDNDE